MRRFLWWVAPVTLLGLVVAACGALDESAPGGAANGEVVGINGFTLSPNGTTLDVRFTSGGPPFEPDDPCSIDYAAESNRRGDVLEVSVTVAKGPGHGGLVCPPAGFGPGRFYRRTVTLELDEPFTGSEIRDANGTHRRLFKERDELAVVTGLPNGWEVQVDSDSPETGGGGWITVYGPYDDPSQQLIFVQAYNGWPHVWRAYTGDGRITVAGVEGRLFETPAGHQAIVWRPGAEGYALYAFEHVLTLEELLALAETVQPSPGAGPPTTPLPPPNTVGR